MSKLNLETIEKLANSENKFVRLSVADTPITPAHILEKLSHDNEYLRSRLAERENLPVELLVKLSEDDGQSCEVR